jgi:hypothetical protein
MKIAAKRFLRTVATGILCRAECNRGVGKRARVVGTSSTRRDEIPKCLRVGFDMPVLVVSTDQAGSFLKERSAIVRATCQDTSRCDSYLAPATTFWS